MLRTLMIAGLASMLTASCASSGSDAKKPTELASPAAQPPARLERPCARPAELPGGALSAGEVERHWGHDRVALAACGARHKAIVAWRRARDAGLAGAPLPEPELQDLQVRPAGRSNPLPPIIAGNPIAGIFGTASDGE